MSEQKLKDKMVVVLVSDMQEGMWDNEQSDKENQEFSELLKRIPERRKRAMEALAADLQPFIDEMRDNGAVIVWAMMKSDKISQYGGLYKMNSSPLDLEVWKDAQSALVNNEAFFEGLRNQAEQNNQELEIYVCGVWALECVINTDVTLHRAGYHSRIIGDAILDSAVPSKDSDRPNHHEANALYQAKVATGRETSAVWMEDLLREQKAISALRLQMLAPNESFEPHI